MIGAFPAAGDEGLGQAALHGNGGWRCVCEVGAWLLAHAAAVARRHVVESRMLGPRLARSLRLDRHRARSCA